MPGIIIHIFVLDSWDALGWVGDFVRRRLGIKVYIYLHGEEISIPAYNSKALKARYHALRGVDHLIAVSHFTRNLLVEQYHIEPQRVSVINNGVNLPENIIPIEERVEKFGKIILSVGRLVRRKGVDYLLQAWPLVLLAVPDARLWLVGDGPLAEEYVRSLVSLGIKDSVSLLGDLDDTALQVCYDQASVFVQPNRRLENNDTEGFGLVFLEAAAHGLPSVGGQDGGVADAVQDGMSGF